MDDLEKCIQFYQEAVNLTPPDHPDRPDRLRSLGIGYRDRYQRIGTMDDLEKCIQFYQEAVNLTPPDHPDRARRLESLGIGYTDRYRRTGTMDDLEKSIHLKQEAVNLTPPDHPDRARRLESLGIGYGDRYQRTGTMDDLEKSIQYYQEAVNLTPPDHPDRPDRLRSLGIGYRDRYQRIGTMDDLEKSIHLKQEAVNLTPPDHPDRPDRLQSLGIGYGDRYQRTGTMDDLEKSIQYYQEAVNLTPPDHPDRPDRLRSLGIGYEDRYRRTGTMDDLEKSIQLDKEAVNLTPPDHPDRARRLESLGIGYGDRYQRTGTMDDLEKSIQYYQEAVNLTPPDHPDRPDRLRSLGIGYRDRYQRIGTMDDLEKCIQFYQEAVNLTPPDHPDRARRLESLGIGYGDRYQRTGAMDDLEKSIELYQAAVDHHASPVKDRLKAGVALIKVQAAGNNWIQAYKVASQAVSFVPLLAPRSLNNADKQHLLIQVAGLASDAAAVTLMAGKPSYEAVQLLELGRAVIGGSLTEMRTDVSTLEKVNPKLAKEFQGLRNLLDGPKTSEPPQIDRHEVAQELERVILDIRQLCGFNRFLLPPSYDELKTAAEDGPIVILNVSKYRCDAFIIEKTISGKTRIQTLPLRDLHVDEIRSRARKPLATLEVLGWLWRTVAQPILHTLGFTQTPPDGCWPHLWWVPTGPLVQFPIHAAGNHSDFSTENVLDRVISSYSTSTKAILYSRRQHPKVTSTPMLEKAVLVAMQKTPDCSDLQFASEEIEKLESLCSSMQLQICRPLPVRNDVLDALKDCKIFHFAGHGGTHAIDPSQSHLFLSDWQKEKLTVASLFETNLQTRSPFLAYLSACDTGRNKHAKLVDEGLHLISAFQLAGFRHVIGTLWSVEDKVCVDVAQKTYQWMQSQGLSDRSVSEGLHHTSRHLRDRWAEANTTKSAFGAGAKAETSGRDQAATGRSETGESSVRDARDAEMCDDIGPNPLHWVPYIHFGV